MCAGRQDETSRPEGHGTATDQGSDLVGGEASPHDGFGLDAGTDGECALAQFSATTKLGVGCRVRVAVCQRLRILTARGTAFVEHDDGGANLCCRGCCRQPGWTAAHHQHVAEPVLGLRVIRCATKVRERQHRVAGDRHAVSHLGHAGALADTAIDGHHAIEAGPHAAMQAARRATLGAPKCDDARGRQRGSDCLAFQGSDRRAVKLERDGTPDWANGGMGQAHCRCSSPCARCGKVINDMLAH